jgi:hypothetical protein
MLVRPARRSSPASIGIMDELANAGLIMLDTITFDDPLGSLYQMSQESDYPAWLGLSA